MPDSFGQDLRIAQLDTPLGKDKLNIVRFDCTEGVSEKFKIRLTAVSTDQNLNFDPAIGQNCTITMKSPAGGVERHFDGVLAKAEWTGGEGNEHVYEMVLRPWLWLASFRRNSLIFHDMTVPEIVSKVLGDYGQVKDTTSRGYPVLEYCVQYRETDMDFVCRLMEEYGISYYFQHGQGKHDMILTDEMSTFESLPGSRTYLPMTNRTASPEEFFDSWVPQRRFTSGKIKLDDYNFKTSETDLVVTEDVGPPFDPGSLEVFDYPGRFPDTGVGSKIAKAWSDEQKARDGRYFAEGSVVTCFPGALVTMVDKDDTGMDGEYLALRCKHSFTGMAYRSTDAGLRRGYEGEYEFMKTDKTFAPSRTTPKPIIGGAQTAKVVGNDDIDVDEYGRILVRFHWDQKEDQSCRVRVAQVWAGKEWGGIFTPRRDMEVLVIFLEGDPDQPLVIGAVYNDKHMQPYSLPSDKSISGVKSRTTPDSDGYNEFIFDDRAGSQLVRLHAERNLESVVENDESRNVKHDRKTEIGNNDTLNVGEVLKITAGTKVEITVGSSNITMTTDTITIKSINVEIKATDFKSDAVTSTHQASGVMTIQGSMVKIN